MSLLIYVLFIYLFLLKTSDNEELFEIRNMTRVMLRKIFIYGKSQRPKKYKTDQNQGSPLLKDESSQPERKPNVRAKL